MSYYTYFNSALEHFKNNYFGRVQRHEYPNAETQEKVHFSNEANIKPLRVLNSNSSGIFHNPIPCIYKNNVRGYERGA